MWKIYTFHRHGSRRPWRPIFTSDNADEAKERYSRELARLKRGHLFLVHDGRIIRHANAARFRVIKL
jgi:hypothetical protein